MGNALSNHYTEGREGRSQAGLKGPKPAEMEKRADGADASVLFFLLGCANFLAVYVQIR